MELLLVEPVTASFRPSPIAHLDVVMMRVKERFLKLIAEIGRDGLGLAEEEAILAMTADVARALMTDAILATDLGTAVVEHDGKRWKRLNQLSFGTYGTMYGEVEVRRPLYREEDVRNGQTLDVLAVRSNIRDGFTPKARAAISHAVQSAPAREAQATMASAGVLPYASCTFARVADRLGADWRAAVDASPAVFAGWDDDVLKEATAVVVELDRASVPMAEPREATDSDIKNGVKNPITVAYRMAYCGAVGLLDKDGETIDVLRFADDPSEGAERAKLSLRAWLGGATAKRPNLAVVTLGDGATEIQSALAAVTQDIEVTARLTDFYHLTEYLSKAVKALGDNPGKTVKDLKAEIFACRDGIDDVEAWLRDQAKAYLDDPPEAVLAAARYIENHRDLMDYVGAHRAGLPLGSGLIEATCKTVIGVRMKRAGARWSPAGAGHVLGLRALATSGDRWSGAMVALERHYAQDVRPAA